MSGLARVDGQAKTLCNGHSFQTSYFDLQLKASFSTLLAQNEYKARVLYVFFGSEGQFCL